MNLLAGEETFKSKKILIVEDDKDAVSLASAFLRKLGIDDSNIEICKDGLSALETVKKNLFDIIIMDFSLPGADGLYIAKKVREYDNGNNTKIIAYTANKYADNHKELFDAFMIKPIKIKDFQQIILDCLGTSIEQKV